jgi:ATP-binding cassette subfamily B protein
MSTPLRQIVERWRPHLGLVAALTEASRPLTTALAVIVALRVIAPVGFVVATASVLARVPATVREGLDSVPGRALVFGVVFMAISFLIQQITPPLQQSLAYMLGNRFHTSLEERFMKAALLPPGIGHLEEPQLQNEVAAATRGLGGFPNPTDAPNALAGRVAARLSFVGAAGVLVVWHWWVALPVLICGVWQQIQLSKSLMEAALGQVGMADATRRSIYYRDLALTPPAAKEIRVFGLGSWLVERYKEHFGAALLAMQAARARQQRPLLILTLITCAAVGGSLLLLGWEAGSGRVGLAKVALVVTALAAAARTLTENDTVRDGLVLAFSLQAIALVKATEERLKNVTRGLSGKRRADDLAHGEIRFENLSFHYPGQDRDVLHGLDLIVHPRESLAIVGANGAGKTTLIKLLCRLYEPTEGRITVNGVDLREIDPSAWQRRIAAIFQDYVKYPLSAADNVTFGGLSLADDSSLLQRTAEKVRLNPIIKGLPNGWNTTLSREFEGGVDLSGGEWQRVALARALFAAGAGASVLILDEPTASLDVRSEAEIYKQFLELTAGLTTLLISHRFSSVRHAQRICVLEGGRVVEEGDHASLLAARGRYAELFHLQAARFAEEEQEQAEAASEVTS